MIKNVIFDIGGVLIDYNPVKALKEWGMDDDRANALVNATTKSYLWQEMDRGFWPDELIYDTMVSEHPEIENDIRDFFNNKLVPLENLIEVKPNTVEWMSSLKKAGYNIYLLSNYPKTLFNYHWNKVYNFKEYVDGKIVSAEVGQMKADQDIYKILLDTYNLKPFECVFIDDRKENVITAKQLGMHGIVYKDFETTSKELNNKLSKKYNFYGWENATVPKIDFNYKKISTPQDLYEVLSNIWCADTCAPRMRKEWTKENMTLGQCSITAFLVQDIFGGRVHGILLDNGNYHCYNVVGDCVFDLTSEQFGNEKLDYSNNPEQFREVHFAKEEKRLRYEYLKEQVLK